MRNVRVTSIVRDGMGYLPRYFDQLNWLAAELETRGYEMDTCVCEGDSKDGSWEYLTSLHELFPLWLYKFDHTGPKFGSVSHPTRWQNIARTWNFLFEEIKHDEFDALIYVEADLIWQPDTMLKLIDDLKQVPAVAPMSMMGNIFYDTHGHRADGVNFTNWAPFHQRLVGNTGELIKLDSAGSCKVMRAEVAKSCRFSEVDAMLGHDIYAKGYSLWLDPCVKVEHP